MKMESRDYFKLNAARPTAAGFPAAARCTNVNTFVILPSLPAGSSGNEASELGFFCVPKF